MARKPKRQSQRQSRMHAAIDAMGVMGFDAKTVQAKCNQLLKEYGGNENWPFIEADAYSVLIESLFEEKQGETKGNKTPIGENVQEANEEGVDTAMLLTEGGGTNVGPSKLLLSPVNSDMKEGVDTAILLIEGGGSDVGPSKLLLSPVSLDITDGIGSHTIRTGDDPNAETNQEKKLESTITSRAPKVCEFPQLKSNNLNGWLIE